MKKKDILHIEKLISEADFEGTPEIYNALFETLKGMEEKYPNNFDLLYYQGLVCYQHPDIDEFRIKWALKFFNKVLELNPNHLFSKIYSGFCNYDLGHYSVALNLFKEILATKQNWIYFEENNQIWRLVNIAEMVAVCSLKIRHIAKFVNYYMPWKELYYLNSRDSDFYFPESLIVEVSIFLKNKGETLSHDNVAVFRKISLDLIGIIKGGDGFEEIYAEELKNLKNWDGHEQLKFEKIYS